MSYEKIKNTKSIMYLHRVYLLKRDRYVLNLDNTILHFILCRLNFEF